MPLSHLAPVGPGVLHIGMEKLPVPEVPEWEWLGCHDLPVKDAATRFPNRTTWREPPISHLCCAPPEGCFRAVYDDRIFIPRYKFRKGQKVRCRNSAVRPSPSAGWETGRVTSVTPLRVKLTSDHSAADGVAWDEVRPANKEDGAPELDDDPHAKSIIEQVRRLLVIDANLLNPWVVNSRWVRQSTGYHANFTSRYPWHFDYGQHASGVFSAILYTGNDGDEPLVGGYTAFVDSPPPKRDYPHDAGLDRQEDGTAYLRRGLAIAPRVGRLVLFTGGAENYHAPLPVASGRRQTLQMWFQCRC